MTGQTTQQICTEKNEICAIGIDRLWIIVVGPQPTSDAAWLAYVKSATKLWTAHGGFDGVLNYSPTQAPTAAQRRIVADNWTAAGAHNLKRRATLTNSTEVRGAMTAVNWAIKNGETLSSVFPPQQMGEALHWLSAAVQFDKDRAFALVTQLANTAGYARVA